MELATKPMWILEQFKAMLKANNTLIENEDHIVKQSLLYLNLRAIYTKVQTDKEHFQYMIQLKNHPAYNDRSGVRLNRTIHHLTNIKL